MENQAGRRRGAGMRAAFLCATMAVLGSAAPASAQAFVEGNIGSAFGSYGEKAVVPPPADTHFQDLAPKGGVGGLGLGYRLRLWNFVVGPRIGFDLSGLSDSVSETDACPDLTVCATKTTTDGVSARWIESAQLEAGYVVANRLVFIGSYGWARGSFRERSAASFTAGTANPLVPPASTSTSASATATGPVWSAGVEYLLGDAWSVGFRYEDTTLDLNDKALLGGATSAKYSGNAVVADVRWYL